MVRTISIENLPVSWSAAVLSVDELAGRLGFQPKLSSFKPKQFLFCIKATAVTRESSICAQNPVAGNNDGNGIVMIGLAHGAEGIRTSNGASDFAIGAGFTVRNAQQRLPAIFLKLRSNQIEFKREST